LILTSLLPVAALAGPPKDGGRGGIRVGAMVIPMDQGAEASSVEVEGYINDALEVYPNFQLKKMEELLGTPPDQGAADAMRRFQKGYDESRAAYDSGKYDEAERRLRSTLKEYRRAAAAMSKCVQLCDALAMYAAILFARGDVEEARNQILDLTALNPTFELSPKRFRPNFLTLRGVVASSKLAMMKGTLIVSSRPAGTRVFLDGEFQGHTPVTITTAPVGKHILRFERPGFVQHGQIVEILPEETEAKADLVPTAAFRNFDALANKLANEVAKNSNGSGTLSSLGNKFGIDRAVVAVARQLGDTNTTELNLALFDMRRGQKLAARRVSFQGNEFGQLKGEISRVVTAMVNTVENPGEKRPVSDDPLDNKAGTEDWTGDDRGGKAGRADQKRKAGDPLDDRNGTEDW
jgi:hypothetical protein